MCRPLVQLVLDAALDARQTPEGREEGLVARDDIEMELEVVCGVDGNGAVLDFGDGMGPGRGALESVVWRRGRAGEGRGGALTYTAWL